MALAFKDAQDAPCRREWSLGGLTRNSRAWSAFSGQNVAAAARARTIANTAIRVSVGRYDADNGLTLICQTIPETSSSGKGLERERGSERGQRSHAAGQVRHKYAMFYCSVRVQ